MYNCVCVFFTFNLKVTSFNVHGAKSSSNNQARVQEFVRGGGPKSESLFFFRGGGPAQTLAEKMIFSTKKVAKYR